MHMKLGSGASSSEIAADAGRDHDVKIQAHQEWQIRLHSATDADSGDDDFFFKQDVDLFYELQRALESGNGQPDGKSGRAHEHNIMPARSADVPAKGSQGMYGHYLY